MRRKNAGSGRSAEEPDSPQPQEGSVESGSAGLDPDPVLTPEGPGSDALARPEAAAGLDAGAASGPVAADLARGAIGRPAGDTGSPAAAAAATRIATVLEAAQEAADRIRREAEDRVRARIAEADRGAENRVTAAEEEAAEILSAARAEASKLRKEAKAEADRAVSEATSRGLEIAGRAQEEADRTLAEAKEEAETLREDIATRARELMRHAEETASEINHEGFHMVGNLRELGDSLRTNADRLLKDVQTIHTRMVAQIERVRDEAGPPRPPRVPAAAEPDADRPRRRRSAAPSPPDDDELDVPEFVPPS